MNRARLCWSQPRSPPVQRLALGIGLKVTYGPRSRNAPLVRVCGRCSSSHCVDSLRIPHGPCQKLESRGSDAQGEPNSRPVGVEAARRSLRSSPKVRRPHTRSFIRTSRGGDRGICEWTDASFGGGRAIAQVDGADCLRRRRGRRRVAGATRGDQADIRGPTNGAWRSGRLTSAHRERANYARRGGGPNYRLGSGDRAQRAAAGRDGRDHRGAGASRGRYRRDHANGQSHLRPDQVFSP